LNTGKSNETKDIKSREMLTSYAYFIFEEISTFPQLWWVMNGWVSGPFFLHCIFYIAERFSCGMEAGIT